ncbi:MAG: CheR family methyltransferase, partial [Sphingomonas sp.]
MPLLRPCQHGTWHRNHAEPPAKKSEFGPSRDAMELDAEIATASRHLADVLETALRGVYPTEMLTPVPADMRRWVMTARDGGRREGRIHPSLRAKLSLARVNLMDETYAVGDPFDMIMCRNVMIYFDKQTQAKVLKRLCDRLKRGGYLFIGHSESITGIELPLVTVAN